jgi:UDP-GlcNAc:undecaprenyl-phosphate/decaprenyl-phosphate GlcNAc-1-phosphate transferase
MMATAIASFVLACLLSSVLTALAWRVSPRIGLVDRPDHQRKLQAQPVPLGGGAAVLLASVLVLGGLTCTGTPWRVHVNEDWLSLLGSGIACSWIVVLGLLDDRFVLRGRQKLLGQIIAALVLIGCGVLIRRIGLFGFEIELGLLAVPVTVLWLTGAINALNLLDGMDGMAAVIGLIQSLAIAALALLAGHAAVAIVALVFAGALLGFLPFNLSPAKIYLGDAGSMLIGVVVGCLSVRAAVKGAGTVLLAAPLAVMTIPILDSLAAVLRRRLAGQSIYAADRSHLHHRLLAHFGNKYKVLVCVSICSAVTCGFALVSTALKNDMVALVAAFAVIATLAATGWFGRGEFVLLFSRLWPAARFFVSPSNACSAPARETTARIQGSRKWETLWATLTESASKLGLTMIHLHVDAPAIQETYVGSWESPAHREPGNRWEMKLPLRVVGHAVGFLEIAGESSGHSNAETIEIVQDMLEPFELRLRSFAEKAIVATVGERRGAATLEPRRGRTRISAAAADKSPPAMPS